MYLSVLYTIHRQPTLLSPNSIASRDAFLMSAHVKEISWGLRF
jgi:hypothetical protein